MTVALTSALTAPLTALAPLPGDRATLIALAAAKSPRAISLPLAARLKPWLYAGAFLALFIACCIDLQLGPQVLGDGFTKLGAITGAMLPPSDGGNLVHLLRVIAQTLAIAVLGTLFGIIFAIPLGLVAARNIIGNRVVHFAIRRLLDIFRGIPVLVWALIMVAAIGLGPIAGIVAIAFADIPRLAKLFAEALENADERQRQSVRVTGARVSAVIRFGFLPQILPVVLSQCLYFLEQNFRSAAVVGIVGGGGIGYELQERIRIFAFDEVAFITLLFVATVALLDFGSGRLRARLS